jgi:antirestriction protein ArdC/phage/plasmid primase-like uncharacterized protein
MPNSEIPRETSNKFIAAMEAGKAPWQISWAPDGRHSAAIFNPVSSVRYHGINALKLMMEGFEDPRWCTYEQARSQGWQVRRGSHGVPLFYTGQDPETGELINKWANVFNAEQLHGIPELVKVPSTLDIGKFSNHYLKALGVDVVQDQTEHSFYSPNRDQIHTPMASSFKSGAHYHAKVVHQILHATGGAGRQEREMGRSFNSPEYAREELAAQIATLFLARELEFPFEPGDHARYTPAWIELLKEDEFALREAVLTARHMLGYMRSLDVDREFFQGSPAQQRKEVAIAERDHSQQEGKANPPLNKERIYLFVPYEERREAYKLGAKLDESRKPKQWYIPADMDQGPFARWLEAPKALTPAEIIQQFRSACIDLNLVMEDDPVMDGQWHHVKVSSSRNKIKRSGAYVLNPKGYGHICNHDTGIDTSWRPEGLLQHDDRYLAQIEQMNANREAADRARTAGHEAVANKCAGRWQKLPEALKSHPYAVRKHIDVDALRRQGEFLIVPMMDEQGRIWNFQRIPAVPGGQKMFEKGGRKKGLFYVLGDIEGASTVLFCEGYASGKSPHMATGLAVVVCFDSGNIGPAMKALSSKLEGVDKIILGDNDLVTAQRLADTLNGQMRDKVQYPAIIAEYVDQALQTKTPYQLDEVFKLSVNEVRSAEHFDLPRWHACIYKGDEVVHKVMINNGGMEKALSAAAETGAKVITPHFSDPDAYQKGWNDFNDLRVQEGEEAVCSQIAAAVDLVKGRAEAARFVREAKHNLIEVVDPAPDGRYVGVMLGRVGMHAVQDIGRDAVVAHPLNKLDKVPGEGVVTKIQYEHGRGRVVGGQDISRGKSNSLEG